MALAFLSAQRSKDPSKQVGACIVSPARIILGIGYNGFPRGCADSRLPWAKRATEGGALSTKYPYVCHAEMNAILNKNAACVGGATLYVTMFPCNECSKLLIQAGIREVVFYEDKGGGGGEAGVRARDRRHPARQVVRHIPHPARPGGRAHAAARAGSGAGRAARGAAAERWGWRGAPKGGLE